MYFSLVLQYAVVLLVRFQTHVFLSTAVRSLSSSLLSSAVYSTVRLEKPIFFVLFFSFDGVVTFNPTRVDEISSLVVDEI
jgi:hypothetical protein